MTKCFSGHHKVNETINAPAGFIIEDFEEVHFAQVGDATSSLSIANDRRSVTINAEAKGGYCVEISPNRDHIFNEEFSWILTGVRASCRSIEPTVQIGEKEVLLITTRGLCCCSSNDNKAKSDEFVVEFKSIPENLSLKRYMDVQTPNLSDKAIPEAFNQLGMQYTASLANELSDFIKAETIKSLNNPSQELKKYYETDFFFKQFENKLSQTPFGKNNLKESISKDVSKEVIPKLEKHFGRKHKEISRRELLKIQGNKLSKLIGEKPEDIQKLKLELLGVKFKTARNQRNK